LYGKQVPKSKENEETSHLVNVTSKYDPNDYPICWVNCQLFDYHGYLKTGEFSLGVWNDDKPKESSSSIGKYNK
jgi:hypothetical protein